MRLTARILRVIRSRSLGETVGKSIAGCFTGSHTHSGTFRLAADAGFETGRFAHF